MKYYFPLHLDGGNRGCEGIAKGTAVLLNEKAENLIGYCKDVELDRRLGIDKFITLESVHHSKLDYIMYRAKRKLTHGDAAKNELVYSYNFDSFLKRIPQNGIVLSTGGDMFCYGDNEAVYTSAFCQKRDIKTVLWGCSFGEKNMTPKKKEVLKHFNLVYARESLTYDYLKSEGVQNIVCLPDPAFVLKPEKVQLPSFFNDREVIGINLSNYIIGDFDLITPFGAECTRLIDYILNKTQLQILLVPHVLWGSQDDRIVAQNIKARYADNDRISILDSNSYNYVQIRYIISKCKYFIGSRTHSVISAYSTSVPNIALGYSIKSKGIAKDLGMPIETIINTKESPKAGCLVEAFDFLVESEGDIRITLQNKMQDYIAQAYSIKNHLLTI